MKKLSILAWAVAGLMMGACSSSDAVDEGGSNVATGKVKGYLNVSVNLPSQGESTSTRAWTESERLADGLVEEYTVDEVLLIIYGGASESTATVQQVYAPSNAGFTNVDDNPKQVTVRNNYVLELNEGTTGPYYILAVINNNNVISVNGNSISVNGTACSTIGDLQTAITNANSKGVTDFINADGHFFMANAVLSLTPVTGDLNNPVPQVLAPVKHIYESASQAAAADAEPSADIYVERGMAKVTLEASLKFSDDIDVSSGTIADPALSGWTLDNTNMKSYVVRNTFTPTSWGLYSRGSASTDKFRFVGYNNVDQAETPITTAYRTYWCFDPNYASAYDPANFYEPATKTFSSKTGDNFPQYCFENTFDVDHQSYQNTTRVVVGVDLNGGKDFYTVANDRKTLYAEADVKALVISTLIQESKFKTWFAANSSATLNASVVKAITWSDDSKAGAIRVKDITIDGTKLTAGTDVALSSITGGADIIDNVNTQVGGINRFVGGTAYYAIRIKHFGDDLTPWNTDEYISGQAPKESGINDIYPVNDIRNANYLGRYGMVRNNWYVIKLGTILKIGHPIIPWLNPGNEPDDPTDPKDPKDENPENPEHPDDALDDSYISVRINILSWAKRPQGWNLK